MNADEATGISPPQDQDRAAVLGKITLAPITLARPIADRHAALAWVDGEVAGVLVRLDHPAHGDLKGSWVLEVAFGAFDVSERPIFDTLPAAERWVAKVHSRSLGRLP